MSGRRRPNKKRFIQSTVDRQRDEIFYLQEEKQVLLENNSDLIRASNDLMQRTSYYRMAADASEKTVKAMQPVINALRQFKIGKITDVAVVLNVLNEAETRDDAVAAR